MLLNQYSQWVDQFWFVNVGSNYDVLIAATQPYTVLSCIKARLLFAFCMYVPYKSKYALEIRKSSI